MKAMQLWRRLAASLLILVSLCLTATAFAYEAIDTERSASLTVSFSQEGQGFSQVEFRIYRVAKVSADGSYALTGDFQEYPVTMEGLDSSGWRALAQTLDAYAARDGLEPVATGMTDQAGQVSFLGLETGLYLVKGEQYTEGDTRYTPEPLLVCLPGQGQEAQWDYDVAVTCKFEQEEGTPQTVKRKVLKVWEDSGDKAGRPEEIAVQLLEDGAVVDTVTLSEENNWQYTWEGLDGSATWQVTEAETPEGYTVSVEQEGVTFVMKNTSSTDTPPPPPSSTIPQTGMFWWPVPLRACGGLLLLLAGCWMRRRREQGHGK